MSAIVWDATGSRFYENGVDHGVLYVQDDAGDYGTGIPWNGLVSVSESPEGAEATDLYADNIKYASLRSTETFSATIEAYTYPDEFAVCDGSNEVASGVYFGQQSRASFGFSYRTNIGNDTSSSKDDGYKIHLVYGATASPSEKSYETINDSPDAITFSWDIDTTPVTVDGYSAVSTVVIDSLKVDADVLTEIENTLYGTDTTEPTLMLPDAILALLNGTATDTEESSEESEE